MGIIRDAFIKEFKEHPWVMTKLIIHVILVFAFGIGMLVSASML